MLLLDVNVLIYAFRVDALRHDEYREWLPRLRRGAEPVAVAGTVLASFLRIVTHPRIFREPDTGSTWVTTDRNFARFPGLRWQHPLHS